MALNQMIFHHILQWIRCYDIGVADIVFASLGCDRLFFLSRSVWPTSGKMIFFFILYWNQQFEFNWFSWWKVKMQWNKWFAYIGYIDISLVIATYIGFWCLCIPATILINIAIITACMSIRCFADFVTPTPLRKNHKLPRESYVSLY